jgi:xanthine dehydrogenase YagS FAD-binding subunit
MDERQHLPLRCISRHLRRDPGGEKLFMKATEYIRADTVGQAIHEHSRDNQSKYLGGGTNLVDLMKYNVEAPDKLIDVTYLPLKMIQDLPNGGLSIGALVRNSDLAEDPRVKLKYPALSQALLSGASPQIRNMATTGGNLLQRTRCYYFYDTAFPCNKREPGAGCSAIGGQNRIHAILGTSDSCIAVHPSDMCVALAMLDAVVQVKGPSGNRSIPILDFHRLPDDTPNVDNNLKPNELITSVDLPLQPLATHSKYLKIRDRASYAFALVSVSAALFVEAGQVREVRLALGGVAHKPWRVPDAERALIGKAANEQAFKETANQILAGATSRGSNGFKIELAQRAIMETLLDLASGDAK